MTQSEPEFLELGVEEMRALGYRVVDTLVEHYRHLQDRPVGRVASRPELDELLWEAPPERGCDPMEVMRTLERCVFSNMMLTNHPRFFAFVPSPSNFAGAMADALASGFNAIVTDWAEASGPAEIELLTVDWLRAACGLPPSAGGLFVSGGSMANLTALATARAVALGGDMAGAVIYCSDQTHRSNQKGLMVLGFEAQQLAEIPADRALRLDVPALEAQIAVDRAAGRRPFCVIANAGTTNTGTVDPLPELAALCERERLWLHVDGAYGAAAVLCERGRRALAGLELADSIAIDPHKWLFQPFEIGCVLVRDRSALERAFGVPHEYLQDVDIEAHSGEVNFCDYGIQLSRGFRALKLWMTIKIFGLAAFGAAIERGIRAAETAEALLHASERFEVVTAAQLAVVSFRFAPPGRSDAELDALNRTLVRHLMADGHAMLSSTRVGGRTVLRLCTINPRTTQRDIESTIARLERLGERLVPTRG